MSEKIPQEPSSESLDIEKSSLREAYKLLNAKTPLELSRNYTAHEQVFFKNKTWDYDEPEQIQNVVKNILESVDEDSLNEDERAWRNEILWLWYHHGISVAGWKKDKEKQKEFSEIALRFQGDNPNILTRTMYLLVHDQISDAEEWVIYNEGDPDHEGAVEMLTHYKKFGVLWLVDEIE